MAIFSFNAILTLYESCQASGKAYLALTPDGPIFEDRCFLVRLFNRIFRGYSYNALQGSNAIDKKVTELLKSPLPLFEELMAARKIIKVSQSILQKSHADDVHDGKNTCLKNLESHISSLLEKAYTDHRNDNESKIDFYFRKGFVEEAYQEVKLHGIPQNCLQKSVDSLIKKARKNNDYDITCSLIEAGTSLETIRPLYEYFLEPVATYAIDSSRYACLGHLLENFPELCDNTNLFFKCVSKGLVECVSLFLALGKINPDSKDGNGNTALHLAFLTGNQEMITLLFQHCNPLLKNKKDKTPFELLIRPTETSQAISQLTQRELSEFINNFFHRKQDEPQGIRLANPETIFNCKALNGTTVDLIEFLFLCNQDFSNYTNLLTKKEFYKAIPFLTKQYPHADVKAWFFEAFDINDKHLKTGAPKVIPKEVPQNTSLNDLEVLFASIPWRELKHEDLKDMYEFVFETDYRRANIEKALHGLLTKLINRVRTRKVDIDTPAQKKALENFYKKIELALRHICAKLLAENDLAKTIKFMKEILLAQNYCGGKLFYVATDQYFQICENRTENPKEYIEICLAEFRQICFDLVVGRQPDGTDVHVTNIALFEIGKKLGLPKAINTFDDPCLGEETDDVDIPCIEDKFFEEEYTPYKIVTGYLLPTIETDAAAGEHYAALQKNHMPKTWNDKRFVPMYKDLAQIPKGIDRDVKARALLKEKYDIEPNPLSTPEQVIEDERRDDYFTNFVYDSQSKRSYVAVTALLEKIGVLKCIFH